MHQLFQYNKSNYYIITNVIIIITDVVTWRSYCCKEKKHIICELNNYNFDDQLVII